MGKNVFYFFKKKVGTLNEVQTDFLVNKFKTQKKRRKQFYKKKNFLGKFVQNLN